MNYTQRETHTHTLTHLLLKVFPLGLILFKMDYKRRELIFGQSLGEEGGGGALAGCVRSFARKPRAIQGAPPPL